MKLITSRNIILLSVLLFSSLFLFEPALAWWSRGNNTHYLITVRSYTQLNRAGLYYEAELHGGAAQPDKISRINKVLKHHQHYKRIEKNLNASLNNYRNGGYQNAAWSLASAFHYLQDAADFSAELSDDYKEAVREGAHNVLQNWQGIMSYNHLYQLYNNTYSNEIQKMRRYGLKDIVRRMQDKKIVYAREMKANLRNAQKSDSSFDHDAENLTKVVLKAIASLQAGQDLIIDMYIRNAGRR